MKNKLLKIFFLDLSYFLLFIFILMVSRSKIQQFLLNIQTYGPELNALDPSQNVLEAQNLLNQISSLSNQVYIFMFLIVPLIIFILYVSLQGYSLYLLKKEKYYLIKFSLASLPSFVFFTLLVFNPNIYLLIILILTSYLSFFLYFKELSEIKLIFTKIYKYFPLYLLYALLAISIISIFFIAYLNIVSDNAYLLLLIFGMIFTLIYSWYKISLIKLFD